MVPRPGAGSHRGRGDRRTAGPSLPAPKVPKQVFIVSDLPKSDRGKVLRDKLKDDWNQRMKLSA